MRNAKGILTHKRWLCALMLVPMLMMFAMPALAESTGVILNPNGGTYANIRQYPSEDACVLGFVSIGSTVQILGYDSMWYCVVANGITGYVFSSFIHVKDAKPTPAPQPVLKTATVTIGPINVHDVPSMQGRVLAQLSSGATVSVISRGDMWTQICTDGIYGYVLTGNLSFGGSAPAPVYPTPAPYCPTPAPYPVPTYPPVKPQPPVCPTNIVTPQANATIRTKNGGNLNLRTWADAYSDVVASFANGTRVRVLTHGEDWCRVQVGTSFYGYMLTKYLAFDGGAYKGATKPSSYNAIIKNANSNQSLNLRAEPSLGAAVLGEYCNGTKVKVLGVGTEWSRVNVNGVTGYMMTKYLQMTSASATANKTVVNKDSFVNLRAGAGYGFKVLKQVLEGESATVVVPYGVWSRVIVKHNNGYLTGYMLNSFLK